MRLKKRNNIKCQTIHQQITLTMNATKLEGEKEINHREVQLLIIELTSSCSRVFFILSYFLKPLRSSVRSRRDISSP